MTVLSSEIVFYKSATVSDAAGNGGRMGTIVSTSSVAQNVFPDVPESERIAGSTKYRKLFAKIENPANEALLNSYLYLGNPTPGDDLLQCFIGTQIDTQADIAAPTLYGVGDLDATVLSGVTSIDVQVENWAAGVIFRNADRIRISDGTNTEYRTVTGAPGVLGNIITLTLDTGLSNGYNSANTQVSSGLPLGDIEATFDSWVETAASSGAYAEGVTGNVVVDAVGGVEQDWTLTFTSGTAFNLSGNTLGAVGSGVIGSNFSPNNPNFSEPYFTILAAGWSGTWQTGDTVEFTTHPAAAPIWYKRVVPAAAASIASSGLTQRIVGESA